MLKFTPKTRQNKQLCRIHARGQRHGKHVRLQPPAGAVAVLVAHSQRRQHHGNTEVICHWQPVLQLVGNVLAPNRPLNCLSNILSCFSIVFCPSFACLSASHLAYSLDVARYAFNTMADNMLNNKQNLSDANARFGLNHFRQLTFWNITMFATDKWGRFSVYIVSLYNTFVHERCGYLGFSSQRW